MNKQSNPIGFFDSGVGGTSIWKEVHALLPFEDKIYLADSKNAPYGIKTTDEILELSVKNTELLLEKNCKLIVVACNTATTNAIAQLRQTYELPFIGIEPAIKPAALRTKSGAIGILATKGTLSSSLFHQTAETWSKDVNVVEIEGAGLVPLVEQGKLDDPELMHLLESYMQPMLAAQIDHLVLGCTHYPYLIPHLKKILPDSVQIIDSGEAVARQTQAVLQQKNLTNQTPHKPSLQFVTNTKSATLKRLLDDVQDRVSIVEMDF